jgi:TolB-like protein/Flp pilus assembly protein TadD
MRCRRNAVGAKLPLDYEFLGEQQVKNIDEPVRAYRAGAGSKRSSIQKKSLVTPRSPVRSVSIAAITVIAAVIATLLWLQPWMPDKEDVSDVPQAWETPDKPSIAVLPFSNMSDDRDQEYFSDGITEDIITDLSKISGLFVIARNSTFQYKRTPVDIKEIARELGVRYVLEGSVRKAGDQVRINAQLIDVATGGHMWADRYDGRLHNIFELQDNVTRKIITALAVQLTTGEQTQVGQKDTDNPEAYDAFLRGWEHYLRQTPEDFSKAVSHFENAIKADPQYARAYAALAATYWEVWKRFWHKRLGLPYGSHEPRYRAEQFLIKAMENPTPLAHQVASAMLLHQQQHEDAIAEAQRAIALDPNDAESYVALAAALSLSGQADEALDSVERAMRLNPHYPAYYLYQFGLARFVTGEFDEAAMSLEKATALNPDDRWSYRLLLATYGLLGRSEDATRALQAIEQRGERGWLNAIDPLTIRTSAFWIPFKEPRNTEKLAEGLRKAGVPD